MYYLTRLSNFKKLAQESNIIILIDDEAQAWDFVQGLQNLGRMYCLTAYSSLTQSVMGMSCRGELTSKPIGSPWQRRILPPCSINWSGSHHLQKVFLIFDYSEFYTKFLEFHNLRLSFSSYSIWTNFHTFCKSFHYII